MILEKKKLFVVILSSFFLIAKAQQSFTKPEAPKTFEYTKYDQIPVGEYTGVPNISIPLYTIAVDEVSIPLNLQYHAGGIRVSDEASYVGLGWNLNFGIISQTINGKDDLKPRNKQKLLYQSTGMGGPAQVWPITCDAYRNMGGGCSADGVVEDYFGSNINLKPLENDFNSMFVATGPVLPHTGLGYPITRSPYGAIDNSVSDPQSDFEPDIFRVSFFGHSLKFMLDFDTTGVENVIVLDNKGYKITKTLNANGFYDWSITTPQGDVYVFSNYKEENNSSSGSKIAPDWSYENPGSGSSTKNNKWYLSKIINLKNKIISFNYTDFGTSTARSFDQKYRKIKQTSKYSSQGLSGTYASIGDYSTSALSEMTETSYNSVTENLIYLSSIESDDAKAYFTYSGRSDRSNDVKLDNIKVKNGNNTVVKEYSFLYDYFISANTGNIINYSSDASYETLKRLKLVSLQETGMPAYSFLYDPIVLPQKNSTAVDFWGFYNGQTTNISTAPNPFQLGYTDMGNNGNNNASNATYSKACSLKEITYPTGGKSSYEYELHEFNKGTADTALPNSDGTIGTIIKGYGNRIKSISLWDNGVIQKQTNYSYSGGISVVPIELHYSYYRDVGSLAVATDIVNPYIMQTLLINDFKSSSYFQPSLFSGINSVGYDTVSMEEVSNGVTNGKTVVSFYNNKALAPSPSTDYKNFMTLPARENINVVENGKVISTKYFDKNDYINPIKTTVNSYTINKSNIYYSTKICGFRTYCGADGLGGVQAVISPQYLVGYYLIYDKQSLLSREVTTDVFPIGSIISTLDYGYDSNNQITSVTKSDSVDGTIYYESTNYATSPSSLVTKNILNLPSSKSIFNNGRIKEQSNYGYDDSSGIVVLKKMDILPLGNPDPSKTKSVFYDAYDVKGNIAEFHTDKGIHTCIIWGYNKTVPIAKIDNISYSSIPSATITNLQNLSDADTDNCITNTCKEQLLRNELNLLRSSFPDAMVTTYTYNPLIGVTSITDPKGLASYYEYDSLNRLKFIKDQDLNILQRNCYNYKGQPINCSDLSSTSVITYASVAKSGSFTRNNCVAGGSPSTVTYTVGAGAYTSTLSQADADAKAQTDVTTNGQAYANANGTCTFKNVVKSGSFTRNNCAAGGTPSTVIYTVAAGSYSSLVSQADADNQAQAAVTAAGQAYANANGTCTFKNVVKSGSFTRNNCAAGGTPSTVTYTVAAGSYSSLVSQADADNQAQAAVTASGQAYANANGSCTFSSVVKSGSFTRNNCAAGGMPSTVTYTVASGSYSSLVSQVDADNQAQAAVSSAGQAYANANGSCTFSSVVKSGSFTRNNCAAGGTPSTVIYTVAAGAYSSLISQADADNQAQTAVTAAGQAYANANGSCTFSSVVKSGSFTRNNCAAGGTPSTVIYTIAASAYSSLISQADADNQAQAAVTAAGQAYANANGNCTFSSVAKSGSFTRNNCATGGTPSTVIYTVAAGAYSSLVSQADADAKAQTDVSTNGQAYANTNGSCTFSSVAKSGSFTRNNCAAGGTPSTVTYTVAAGAYSSLISQADADTKAQTDVSANGQAYANANGICTYPVPAATTLLLLNTATLNSLSFYWNSVTGATGYKIYQNGVYVSSTTGPSGSISGLSSATTYNIQVSAYNAGGVEGPLCASVPMTTLNTYVNTGSIYNGTGHTISAGTMQIIANGTQECSISMPSLAAGATFSFSTAYSPAIYSNGTFVLKLYSSVGILGTNYMYMQSGSSSTNGYFSNQGWGWQATVTSVGPQYSLSLIIK